jgi:hypothetical protein
MMAAMRVVIAHLKTNYNNFLLTSLHTPVELPQMSQPQQCRCCNGSGVEKNHEAIGAAMRKRRTEAGLSLRKAARLAGISFSYLSQLERGERHWTPEVEDRFLSAIMEAR